MNITVFGGAGFLGSHVCDKLSDAGHNVTIFDVAKSPWIRPEQSMIIGDVLDENSVLKAVENADIVYNFAGIADIGEASKRPIDTVKFNILGNINILEACKQANIKRFVFASSLYVYSKYGGFYRCSKQSSELYIENYQQEYNLPYTILRYGSLYGPRADLRNAIYRFVHEALTSDAITYYGKPTALREYIHVEDAALCSLKILDKEYENTHVILSGNQPMRVEDILKMIREMLGKELTFKFLGEKESQHYEITPYSFSPKIAKKLTQSLSIDLGQGILHTIEEIHAKNSSQLYANSGYFIKKDN